MSQAREADQRETVWRRDGLIEVVRANIEASRAVGARLALAATKVAISLAIAGYPLGPGQRRRPETARGALRGVLPDDLP